jgi:tRNA threonylcarbamoyl adenosine modification protein YeaZ
MSDVALLLDSAMPVALVGIARDGVVVTERALATPQRHAEELATAVDACLRDAKVSERDVTRVLVGTGPGSFIGVRIALSFAQGFARALSIPAQGFSTPFALAMSASLPHGDGLVVLDAKKDEFYILAVRVDDTGVRALGDPEPLAPADVMRRFPTPAFVVGNALSMFDTHTALARVSLNGVRASGVVALRRPEDLGPPLPDYRRAPDVRLPAAHLQAQGRLRAE